jgi:Domain of unknown function (DUF4157)
MKQQAPAKQNTAAISTAEMFGVLRRKCDCGTHTLGGGICNSCSEKQQKLQRRPARIAEQTGATEEVPSIVHETLCSPGQPLDAGVRSFMESRFGHDFSRVRVHTDAKAAQSAQAVNAIAFTVGRHIVFGNPHPRFDSSESRQTMAHELAHTIQQNFGDVSSRQMGISSPSDASEREAEYAAETVMQRSPSEIWAGWGVSAEGGMTKGLDNQRNLSLSKRAHTLQRLPASTPASFYEENLVLPYRNATPLSGGVFLIQWYGHDLDRFEPICKAIAGITTKGAVEINGGCAQAMNASTQPQQVNAVRIANTAAEGVLPSTGHVLGEFCKDLGALPPMDAAGLREWRPTITITKYPTGTPPLPSATALSFFPNLRPENNVKVKVKSTT